MKIFLLRKSLVAKVLFSYIICLIVTVSIVIAYNYHSTRKHTSNNLNNKARDQVQMLILHCEKLFEKTEQIAYDTSYMLSLLHGKLADNDIYESLIENMIWNQNIKSITLAFLKDKNRTSGIKSISISLNPNIPVSETMHYKLPNNCPFATISHKDFCNEDWFLISLKKENLNGKWFGQYFDKGIITYTYPLYSYADGKEIIEGVIKLDIKLEWLIKFIKNIKIYKTGYCTFLSDDGNMLRREGTVLNVFKYAEKTKNPYIKEILKRVMSKDPALTRYYDPIIKEWFLAFTYPYESWWFGIIVPEKEFFEEMFSIIAKLLTVGFICLLIPIPLIIYLTLRQTKFLSRLTNAAQQISKGNFDSELPSVNTHDEVGVLNNAFIKMKENIKNHIENIRLMTEAKKQIEYELTIAERIQKSIIPQNFPNIEKFDFKAFINPAKTVGGDYYDFFFIDKDHFCFMIGDVSGKSIPGAMFMAISKTMIKAKLTAGLGLSEAINSVNKNINKEGNSGMFLTLFAGILNIRNDSLEICNAGHCLPALYKNSSSFEYLTMDNMMPAIGMIDFVYKTNLLTLETGDILFLYTDGVTEAMDINQKFFLEQNLKAVLNQSRLCQTEEILSNVYNAVLAHQGNAEQSDDICMVVLKYKESEFLKIS